MSKRLAMTFMIVGAVTVLLYVALDLFVARSRATLLPQIFIPIGIGLIVIGMVFRTRGKK